jgi:aryl-alcohol dehydrogenase-like predicted oxidoreductase
VLESLHALGTERLALFYLHRAEETNVPTLESLAFAHLQDSRQDPFGMRRETGVMSTT